MEGGKSLKTILFIATLSLLTVLAFGFDIGGNIEDSTYLSYTDDSNFYHADTLSLWLTTELWEDTNLFVQGSYTYTTDSPWFFDLDYANIVNKSNSLVNYTFGRFSTSDFSGYIFSHKLDGLSVNFNLPALVLSAKAGYTGFLFDTSSTIEMTLSDQTGISYESITQNFAAPRIVGGVEAFFPDLYFHQDLKAGVWAQFDMRNNSDITTGGKLDTQYFGLALSGPVISSLYYDSFVYLETGSSYSGIGNSYSVLSYLGSAGLRYYMEEFLYSRIAFRFLYSSGDADYITSFTEGNTEGNSTNFIPISGKSTGLVFSPDLGNIFLTQFSYSLKPFSGFESRALQNIQFVLTDINFFRSTTGLISESEIDPDSASLYLGTEIDGTINFRPFSDFGLSLSGGVFIPNNGTDGAFLDTRDVEFLGRLGFSFGF